MADYVAREQLLGNWSIVAPLGGYAKTVVHIDFFQHIFFNTFSALFSTVQIIANNGEKKIIVGGGSGH